MDMSIGIQEDIVGLDISVDDILGMHVSQGTSQFSNPESDRLFGECLSRDVESQITARHQIDYKIHVFNVLETVSQVTDERVVDVFEHSALTDDVTDALGSYDFIFADVFEGKGQIGVLAFDDSNLSKGASADDSQQTEVIEVHFAVEVDGLSLAVAHREGMDVVDDVELS